MHESDEPASVGDVLLDDLRRLVERRQVVVIVGTGVSVGATERAAVASWAGLIEHGIDRCVELRRAAPEWAERQRAQLQSGELDELLSVAELVASRLGAPADGEYGRWLRETVGTLRVQRPEVLEALRDLGVPLATTNYDDLIEEVTGLAPVTWRESARVERVLRGDEPGVLHLHGHWADPESVVLGIRSYEQVVGDEHAQAVLRALRLRETLLFIGFGGGLADPNFGPLLRWTREVFAGSEYRHFRLARTGEVHAIQQKHPPEERLFVVPYGERHDDLAPFLRELSGAPSEPRGEAQGDALTPSPDVGQVWNVPHEHNPDFIGREAVLEQIASALGAGGEAAVVQAEPAARAAVHGLGGVGKTQLVVEYAHRHAADYDIVWWLRSEEPASLAADYVALAGELGLSEAYVGDQNVVVASVRRWLERGERRWLLVFDNAEAHEALREYLPRRGGHVLATSRSRDWPRAVRRIEVDVLEPAESALFLLRRTKTRDERAARDLAEELGHLPLALAQAGAYVDAVGLSLAGYLARYRDHRAELLRRGKPGDYPYTVATTWELSFRAASEQASAAEALMDLLAFLAPEAVPVDLLVPHRGELPESLASAMADSLALDDVVAALRRYSLVEVVDDRSLSVHRLVQFVARERLPEAERRQWAGAAVRTVNSAFPHEAHDVRAWPVAARLLPHAVSAADFAEELDVEATTTAQLLHRAGRYLTGRAFYARAQSVLERALALHERAPGGDSADAGMVLNDLAVVHRFRGDLNGARELHERALEILERVLGSDHPDVALSLDNLAGVMAGQGELQSARQIQERALAIRESRLGADDPLVAFSLNNLADTVANLGDKASALALHERALAIREAALGPDHPDVAQSLHNVGSLLLEQGDLVGAQKCLERSLGIFERSGFRTGETTSRRSIANIDLSQGRYTSAVRNLRIALAFDQEHGYRFDEARDFAQLGRAAAATGRSRDAWKLQVLAWLVLQEAGDPGADEVRRGAQAALAEGPFAFAAKAATIKEAFARDRGRAIVQTAFGNR